MPSSSKSKRLAQARKFRLKTARALAELKSGKLHLISLLEEPPPEIARVRLYVLMTHAPHMGDTGVNKCLQHAGVWPTTRVGNLTPEERGRVISHLPKRARGGENQKDPS